MLWLALPSWLRKLSAVCLNTHLRERNHWKKPQVKSNDFRLLVIITCLEMVSEIKEGFKIHFIA